MSIVSIPRHVTPAPSRTRQNRESRLASLRHHVLFRRRGLIFVASALFALAVVMIIYVNDRQVGIVQLQQRLVDAQAQYAAAVDTYTRAAAPERIIAAAGNLHLTVPKQVLQIHAVSLSTPLSHPHFVSGFTTQSRVLHATNSLVASVSPRTH